MRQTLLLVPIAWVWVIWFAVSLFGIIWLYRKHKWGNETKSFIPFVIVTAGAIYLGLPHLVVQEFNPADPAGPMLEGLPVRGYGFFMLIATVVGVGLAAYRAKSVGFNADMILSLAFWMFVSGIVGARLFYIIQKFEDEFRRDTFLEMLGAMANMTSGGLVVYGSLIGALIGSTIFFYRHKLPVLKIADIIAPSMAIGLAIGRIGCLMNGCCYGSVCDLEPIAIRFPQESPPFYRHLETGQLFGAHGKYETDPTNATPDKPVFIEVDSVDENSIAQDLGIKKGDRIRIAFDPNEIHLARFKQTDSAGISIVWANQAVKHLDYKDLPLSSLKIHPTQIYSAINAALLFALLWFYYPFRKSNGEVLALMLIIYSITRFLLEVIRTDEFGLFGTFLTISQWVSCFMLLMGIGLLIYARSSQGKPHRSLRTTFSNS